MYNNILYSAMALGWWLGYIELILTYAEQSVQPLRRANEAKKNLGFEMTTCARCAFLRSLLIGWSAGPNLLIEAQADRWQKQKEWQKSTNAGLEPAIFRTGNGRLTTRPIGRLLEIGTRFDVMIQSNFHAQIFGLFHSVFVFTTQHRSWKMMTMTG